MAAPVRHSAIDHLWIHESPRADLIERDMLRVFVEGEGAWLTDDRGDRYLDLCSSMWQAPLGHGREDIVEAYAAQARRVASAGPIFFTTDGAVELAERLAAVTPGDLNKCFLTSSGSEATETAIKLARQYHRLRGDHHRFKFVSRYGAYHGAGVGGTSLSGRRHKDALYYPLTPGGVHVLPPTGTNDVEKAEAIRTAIELEGPDTVAAVIGEPVSITEFRIPDADYWPRVREICDEYGVLLIVDETLTGCCRSGNVWAIERWGVVPDAMVVAKSLSAGYAPISALVVREHVYEAFGDFAGSPSVQSYGGHGASSAAGAKTLEIYVDERMHEVAEALGQTLQSRLEPLRDRAVVKDLRRLGSWLAFELCDPRTGETLARGLRGEYDVARHITRSLLDHGCAAARMSEGLLHISPPYVSTAEDVDFIVETIPLVLDDVERIVLERSLR
ncbi:MAG TPA: aminotransferase class III-fold pyridoxal phosphate-dependent enzyme [Gaiellaceae bacterium]